MTYERNAVSRIRVAAGRMESTAREWNAVDLKSIGECIAALEGSVTDLTEIAELMPSLTPAEAELFRAGLERFRRNALSIERLVDSSAALLRGLPGWNNENDGMYGADGAVRPASAPANSCATEA